MLSFESGNYYYLFYNKKNKLEILSSTYWDQQMPKYINFKIEDGLLSYTRFIKVDYYDPFLTGFYNSKDSIIVQLSNLRDIDLENKDQLFVNYFSTTDTLIKLNKNISVGHSLEDMLFKLQIANYFNRKKDVELVLMETTTQVDNAWYKKYPDNCSEFSISVVLSIKNNKLTRIQYFNLEYIDYVFKQKNVLTKDIHYH
ncbi:MAG: hypothetical protein IPJ26_07610 [Bacteroidetes bacterium]|nr:hypothetical protein [Bacteroidota bacterium]